MALLTNAIKGTQDTLPKDSHKLRFVEQTIADIAMNYGFKEIRTPVFEHTELFNRSVGDTTDVVQKEMYTFEDKGGRSITLRPEGTAGAVRSFLEHGLFDEPMHPYTQALLDAIPIPDPDVKSMSGSLSGDVPSPLNPPSGCCFHTRCKYATAECAERKPAVTEVKPGHFVACHRCLKSSD